MISSANAIRLSSMLMTLRLHHFIVSLVILAGAIAALPLSFFSATNVWMGALLLPYGLIIVSQPRFNFGYCLMAMAFGALSIVYGVRMFYFFTLAFSILTLVEFYVGRTHRLILFLLLAMSPFFNQVIGLLGFPIRILLSEWAGNLLATAGWDVHTDGNIIVMSDATFSVDQACMGLNMLAISMLMTVFMIAFHMRKFKKTISFTAVSSLFTLTFILNVASNFLRILILVVFKILPEHPLHELVGIVCLLLYILLPLYFITKWIISKLGQPLTSSQPQMPLTTKQRMVLYAVASSLFIVGIFVNLKRHDIDNAISQATIHHDRIGVHSHFRDIKMKHLDKNITKLSNNNVLLYLKPIPEFFTGDHSPLFCWQGGGYEFKKINIKNISGNTIYVGQIIKGDEKLFTAWWYSNGEIITIDQFDWRIRMMKGEHAFNLVNVTCATEQALQATITELFSSSLITLNQRSI
ncbi:exosortase N [Pseudochryseolinea flava]|nr:exosortase N [Pseudochryseolinea flava]